MSERIFDEHKERLFEHIQTMARNTKTIFTSMSGMMSGYFLSQGFSKEETLDMIVYIRWNQQTWIKETELLIYQNNLVVLICGTRTFRNKMLMEHQIVSCRPWLIISGGAPGADTLAEQLADKYGIEKEIKKAEWGKYGSAAGPLRNDAMLKSLLGTADRKEVWAFFDGFRSVGTMDTVTKARKFWLCVREFGLSLSEEY